MLSIAQQRENIALARKAAREAVNARPTGFGTGGPVDTPPPPAPGLLGAFPVGPQVPGTTRRLVTEGQSSRGGRTRRRFKKKRLMSRAYCKKTPCRRMGFTQKASCRPYKNCYTRRK